jgi:hypothetical protein
MLKKKKENLIKQNVNFFTNTPTDYPYTCCSLKDLNLNKTGIMQEIDYQISCVPFFDGLFVSSENPYIRRDLEKFVFLFNERLKQNGSLVQFKRKDTIQKDKRLDRKKLTTYENVRSVLKDLRVDNFIKLLTMLKIDEIKFKTDTPEGIHEEARRFRRLVYQRLSQEIEYSKKHGEFTSNFMQHLEQRKNNSEDSNEDFNNTDT